MNRQPEQRPSSRRITLGGVDLLSAGMLGGGLIAMTYFSIEPAFNEVERIERSRDELLARHGLRNVDDVFHAMMKDDQFRVEVKQSLQRRQLSYFVANAEAWAPAVRVFTFRSVEGAAIASAKMGRVAVFVPGIIESFVLLFLGGYLYLLLRRKPTLTQ